MRGLSELRVRIDFRKGARGLYSGWNPMIRIVTGFRVSRPPVGDDLGAEEGFLCQGRARRSTVLTQIGYVEYVRRVYAGDIREPRPPRRSP